MADTRGCWSLSEAWAEKGAAEWVPVPNVWVTPSVTKVNTGYIGGGAVGPGGGTADAVNKMNFDNSTTSNIGSVGSVKKSSGSGGNTHGYWAGNASYSNNMWKVIYATDARSNVPGQTLSAGRGYATGCNSDSYAYVCAGAASFNSYVSIVDRITTTTDTAERITSADLPSANRKQSAMATTAHPSAAYISGGVSPATTAVSKLTFSSETSTQVPSGALVAGRGYHTATSNGTNSYFYGGGTNNNGSICTSDILKTVYATDTNSLIPANLNGEWGRSGACGGTTFGVIAGGYRTPNNYTASADKFTYSNETRAAVPGMNINSPKKETAGLSARNGFTGTAYDGTTTRWFDNREEGDYAVKFDGDNDYLSITGWDSNSIFSAYSMTWECWVKFTGTNGTLETIWENRSSTSSNDGFLIGRFHTSGHENKIEMYTAGDYRITTDVTVADNVWTHVAYSRDGNNAEARIYINGTEAGSFTDGYNYDSTGTAYIGRNASNSYKMNGYISNMRFVKGKSLYTSNFTVPTEPLTSTSQDATASQTKFIICNTSDIEEGTVLASGLSISESGFSSEDSASGLSIFPANSPPAATPTSSTSLSGPVGLKLEGYIGKGRQPAASNDGRTDVYKFSYSTETWSSSVSGTMVVGRKFPGATSNTTRGYWAGGTPGTNSQVDKFVWSTNTGSTIPATLSAARGYMTSAAGNQTQGYFTFGNGDTDACDKLVYSNETMSSLPSMPFDTSRGMGVSMQTHGYYGSGAPGGSRFSKITFANDSKTQYNGLRAHPSGSNMFRTAASSKTKVYVCSGESSTTATESIPWATDSVSQLPTSFMPAQVTGIAGQGDNTNAYFTGGPSYSHTQRIVYSSDTVSVLPGANFPAGNVNAYGAGGPGMNGIASSVPNVI